MRIAFTRQRLATRVGQLGRAISKDYAGKTLDVVIVLENSFLFAADLVREISGSVVCHFVRSELRDVRQGGHERREVFFSAPPVLQGRHVLVIDAVLNTGVTQDFLLKRIEQAGPRSLHMAVLFDKPEARRVDLRAEYTGFAAASKQWVGYGLAGKRGFSRNLPYVAIGGSQGVRQRRERRARVRGTKASRG
ncbi:MAG TPA: phosphoribosyltransferase family protein [Candidatus Acidoferrales bacterium]|nr:phosphoribosyltransferase family protein [Candidatus Acidoferrales bacterium]